MRTRSPMAKSATNRDGGGKAIRPRLEPRYILRIKNQAFHRVKGTLLENHQ
jgi:hypothetical protein